MRLFHGTTERRWRAMQQAGSILPRKQAGVSNWDHTCKSHLSAVYLTDAYAPYFAINALTDDDFKQRGARVAIIEVNVDMLRDNLVPDEDSLEQATRPAGKRIRGIKMFQRTAQLRAKLHTFRGTDSWITSINAMGTCAHMGEIPMDAIKQVALVDIKQHAEWSMEAMQPLITVSNYRYCGESYRQHTLRAFEIGVLE